jgi:hypothetical protein
MRATYKDPTSRCNILVTRDVYVVIVSQVKLQATGKSTIF